MKYKIFLLLLMLYSLRLMAQAPPTYREFLQVMQKLPLEKDKAKKADLFYQAAMYYLEKEGSVKSDLDSAAQFNRELITINKQLRHREIFAQSLLLNSKIATQSGKEDLGIQLKKKALQYAITNNLLKEQANAYYYIADGMPYEEEALMTTYYRKAAELYHKSGQLFNEAEVYNSMGLVAIDMGKIDEATKYITKALALKQSIKRYDTYKEFAILANIHIIKGELTQAVEYALKAEKIAEAKGITGIWPRIIYNYLGSLYTELGIYDKALEYSKKALEQIKKTDDPDGISTLTVNIGNILSRQGKFAEALKFIDNELHYKPVKACNLVLSSIYLELHCKLEQYDKALPYYENLLKCNDDKGTDRRNLEFMYHAITQYLIMTKQAGKSYYYINKLNILAKDNKNLLEHAKIEQEFYKADSATGNFAGAFEHVKRYKALKDSIFNISNIGQLHDMQLKYETEKKDRNIKLLNSQNQLQRSRADNAEKTKNITLGGIIFSLVIIALLFSLYRIKQRSNNKLEAHQRELDQKNAFLETLTTDQDKLLKEKEWLVKEVHHRVKNNLQMVTSLLYSQSVYLEDDAAKRAVKDSLHRMQAMALIHQKLYQDENTSTVSMPEYIAELLRYLRDSFDTEERIVFNQSVEPVQLDVSQAVPLGLIVTESIVNAIKYAFINEQNGTVSISLHDQDENWLLLEISDDGVGLPSAPQEMERNSLGLDLMEGLAKQLKGTFSIKSDNGVHISVRFEKNKRLYI